MTADTLSRRQGALLQAIRDVWRTERRPPSIRQLRDATGISSNSVVVYNLWKLVRLGLVTQPNGEARNTRLILRPGDECPCCGQEVR